MGWFHLPWVGWLELPRGGLSCPGWFQLPWVGFSCPWTPPGASNKLLITSRSPPPGIPEGSPQEQVTTGYLLSITFSKPQGPPREPLGGPWSGFSCPGMVSAALGWFQLPWGGLSCPGVVSAALGGLELPWGGFNCPGVISTAMGWFQLPWGGLSCPGVVSTALGWLELPWGGFSCSGVA